MSFKKIKDIFQNKKFLDTALTHRSYLNENKNLKTSSNERLEFLGDAVLELIVSLFLYKKYPNYNEGQLTSLRAKLVQTKTLAFVCQNLEIGTHLKMSKGEIKAGGRFNKSILADTFEALIGAIFEDKGFNAAFQFVEKNLLLPALKKKKYFLPRDFKSEFQEKIQALGWNTPIYKVIAESGPDHNKTFICGVWVRGKLWAKGIGKSKQKAEENAAEKAIKKIKLSKKESLS